MSLKNLFRKKPDYIPFFTYSDNPVIKRQQIWENLKRGLLIEDTQKFIYWNTPFSELYKYQESRQDTGDRIRWYFGKHTILDGYNTHLESMKWIVKPDSNPVAEIYSHFGVDDEGQQIFNYLDEHLTQLLGKPSERNLTNYGKYDLGTIIWKNENVQIRLSALEIFNYRYSLNVGLVNNPNNKSSVGIIFRIYLWFCMKFNIDVKI